LTSATDIVAGLVSAAGRRPRRLVPGPQAGQAGQAEADPRACRPGRGRPAGMPGMSSRAAGDFDYEPRSDYAVLRRSDPRIAAYVHAALGPARTVLNVGAGAGSYEPADRDVIAVEPSASMRSQRPGHSAPAIDARAEQLPFADGSFDAVMATVTVHQWAEPDTGLREMRRVSRGPVVVLTFDGDTIDLLWLADYVPELITAERRTGRLRRRIHRGLFRQAGAIPGPCRPAVAVGVGIRGRAGHRACRRAAARRPGLRRLGPPLRGAQNPAVLHRLAPADHRLPGIVLPRQPATRMRPGKTSVRPVQPPRPDRRRIGHTARPGRPLRTRTLR